MIRFFKNLFKAKDPGPVPEAPYKVEAPEAKVEVVNAQPIAEAEAPKAKAPAKPRAPAKPKAEKKPAAMKASKKPRAKKEAK